MDPKKRLKWLENGISAGITSLEEQTSNSLVEKFAHEIQRQ
jgi:hypothetical protein